MEQFTKSVTFHAVVMDKPPTQKLSQFVTRTLQSVLDAIGNHSMRVASSMQLCQFQSFQVLSIPCNMDRTRWKMVLKFKPS